MKRIASWPAALAAAAVLSFAPAAGGLEVPLLDTLRKPVEVAVVQEEAPVVPSMVTPEKRIEDPAKIAPAGAVWYLAAPDAIAMSRDWNASALGELAADPAVARTFRNNRFGLQHLFGDLPASIIVPERVGAASSAIDLAHVLAGMSAKMAFAAYIDAAGDFSYLFLFDTGLDRTAAFETMTEWETSFLVGNPGTEILRDNHAGNFIDVWRLKKASESIKPAEVAAGFAENIAIVTNDSALAKSCMALLSEGESLADSHWGQRLAASVPNSATADLVGFVRMDTLLKGLEFTPIARDAVAAWADLIGHGEKEGEAIYYGLQFAPDGTRETFLLPTVGPAASASLVELVAKRLRPAAEWTAPLVIPYQPNPSLYVAAMLDGRQLGTLLRQERRLFGLSDRADAFEVPPAARAIFTNEVVTLLTGEIGIAFFPSAEGGSQWLMVLPVSGNPDSLLSRAESMIERGAATIRSKEQDWRTAPSWMTATPDKFRRLTGNFIMVASAGDLLISAADQLVAGSSFAGNRDFVRAMSKAEAEQGMVFYVNVPEIVIREYPNLSSIMRSLYPRSSGLNSRPPLALLRRYAKGLLGVVAPVGANAEFTRLTVQSPVPSFGALATGVVMGFPRSLRRDGREDMAKSRENLQNLWLRLQLFSSRFGHFPDSLEDLAADMRLNTSEDDIRGMLTAPAALARMDSDAAMAGSYRYLSGVTPNDEPDVPLVYETEPWSEDFAGMYPTDDTRAPAENGDYQQYRQYIRLDGKLVTIPEKRFQARVVGRLAERE